MIRRGRDSLLVLFPGALGDFLCFLPTLLGLRQRHRGAMLLVGPPAVLTLLRLPEVATASMERREIANLHTAGAPISAETEALLGGFARVCSWTGAGSPDFTFRLGGISPGRVEIYPFRGMHEGEHAVDYYARCAGVVPVAAVAGALAEDAEWLAAWRTLHHLGKSRWMVMHAGSGSLAKNWEGFDAVARSWKQRHGEAIVLLEGPVERERHIRFESAVIRVSGRTLVEVAALLHRSRLYLGNDSGISQLASVLGTRGVVLFGPSDPRTWAPRGLRLVYAPQPCGLCGTSVFCAHRLPAEKVIAALEAERSARD